MARTTLALLALLCVDNTRGFSPLLSSKPSLLVRAPARLVVSHAADDESSSDSDSSSSSNEQSDDDDAAPAVSEGDWRAFRAKLMEGGFGLGEDDDDDGGDGSDAKTKAEDRRKAVAPRNAALLRQQNPKLAAEYMEGGWAHATGMPEAGGLMLRRPFEAELMEAPGHWRDTIRKAARKDMIKSMAPAEFEEKGLPSSPEALDARFEAWTANKPYMFRLTEKLVKREMARIVASVGSQGGPAAAARAGAAAGSPPQRRLRAKFNAYHSSWQEVVLLLSYSPTEGATGVVINRPLTQGLTPQLAALIHGGQGELEKHIKNAATKGQANAFDGQDDIRECECTGIRKPSKERRKEGRKEGTN